ncbi:hypothetical protein Fmac_025552 [Flemingia macrophylla]|uniref:Uncharacterized protein n=1 Tax=Flemingia macrophylla TaxID=520843 RepID=A0ABD1LSL7_9FABA
MESCLKIGESKCLQFLEFQDVAEVMTTRYFQQDFNDPLKEVYVEQHVGN